MRDKGTYKGAQHIVTVLQEEPAGTVVILTMSHYTGVEVTVAMAWYSCVFCDLSEHWSDHIFSILSNKLVQFWFCPLSIILSTNIADFHATSQTPRVLLWEPLHGISIRGRPKQTFVDVLRRDTARLPESRVTRDSGISSLTADRVERINVIPDARKYQWYSRCGITAHVESAISQVRHIHNDREVYRMENDQSDHE